MPSRARVRELVDDIRESAAQFINEQHPDASDDEVYWDMAQAVLQGEPSSVRTAVLRDLGF